MDEDKTTSGSARAASLEKATFKFDGDGPDRGKEIPALDPRWCDSSRIFPEYFPIGFDNKVHVRPYLRDCFEVVNICKWLLNLPYHKFWSQVVFGDKSFRLMLDSYLSMCPRLHDPDEMRMTFFCRHSIVRDVTKELYENMLYLILRMTTNKESSRMHYMNSEFHGKLIGDYKIFDIPRLVDFCSVYGHVNEKLARRIVDMVLKDQPKLYDQLTEFSSGIIKILAKCENDIERAVGRKVKILRKTAGRQDEVIAEQITRFLTDLVYSVTQFAKFCPKALEYYHEAGLTTKIPHFVEQTVTDLLQDLYDRDLHGGFRLRLNDLIGRLGAIRSELVYLWRRLIEHNFMDKINNAKPDSKEDMEDTNHAVDEILGHLTDCLSEKTFLRVYASKFPFSTDIDQWITRQVELDMDRVQYISEAIDAALTEETGQFGPASARPLEQMNIQQSDIAQICDIFPDYDAAQALMILKHYEGNADTAINAVLSGWVPADCPQLPKENQAAAVLPPLASASTGEDKEKMVPLRESSKRGGGKNVMEDKSTLQATRALYERYQHETEENEWEVLAGVQPLNAPLPVELEDDEYDDTYDDQAVDLGNDMTTDETAASRGHPGVQRPGAPFRADSEPRQFGGATGGSAGPSRPYRGGYTGGRDRQDKERNKGRGAHHDRKFLAMKKSRGGGGGGFY